MIVVNIKVIQLNFEDIVIVSYCDNLFYFIWYVGIVNIGDFFMVLDYIKYYYGIIRSMLLLGDVRYEFVFSVKYIFV